MECLMKRIDWIHKYSIASCEVPAIVMHLTVVLIMMMLVAVTKADCTAASQGTGDTVTVYLHGANELLVRLAAAGYEEKRKAAAGTGEEEGYPEIVWNLVDKSYLSKKEFEQSLFEELRAGEGPDVILTGEGGIQDAQALLEAGYLYDISGYENPENTGEYLAGALEAGQIDGRQYLIPLTVEFPVVYGKTEVLEQEGLTADRYHDLEEFLDVLMEAQEASGKAAFEDASALEWLLHYEMEDDGASISERKELLEGIRCMETTEEDSGDYFAAHRGVEAGQCLLGGCGIFDFSRMIKNMALSDIEQLTMLYLPSWDGEIHAVIAKAVGVNKNSKAPEAAIAALKGFQRASGEIGNENDISALASGDEWYSMMSRNLSSISESVYGDYADQADTITMGTKWLRQFRKDAEEKITGTVLPAVRLPEKNAVETERSLTSIPDVITVMYDGQGMGKEAPLTRWLSEAAEHFSDEQTQIQLIACNSEDYLVLSEYGSMGNCGAAPDIVIAGSQNLLYLEEKPRFDDLSEALEEYADIMDQIYAIPYDSIFIEGKCVGIPVSIRAYGIWCGKEVLQEFGSDRNFSTVEISDWLQMLPTAAARGKADGQQMPVQVFADSNSDILGLLSCLVPVGQKMLSMDEEGKWRTDRAVWAAALENMQGLVKSSQISRTSRSQALQDLLSGNCVMALGTCDLSKMLSRESVLTWDSRLCFVPLSPYVEGCAAYISEDSERKEKALQFLLSAVQEESYADNIRRMGHIPVTRAAFEAEETDARSRFEKLWIQSAFWFPIQSRTCSLPNLWNEIWEGGKEAAELSGAYEPYPWVED